MTQLACGAWTTLRFGIRAPDDLPELLVRADGSLPARGFRYPGTVSLGFLLVTGSIFIVNT